MDMCKTTKRKKCKLRAIVETSANLVNKNALKYFSKKRALQDFQ